MKPDPSRFLEIAAAHLMLRTAPSLGGGYEQSSIMMLGVLLGAVREEFERAAARRVEENQALRQLFADAVATVENDDLRGRLGEQAQTRDESLRVADLERGNDALRALLIELHAHVEELEGPQARRLEQAIWDELCASTERRRLMMGAF